MNGDHTERLSQESECRNEAESGLLESASTFAQRVLEEIEALAGTTTCKPVQLVRLKKWAQEHLAQKYVVSYSTYFRARYFSTFFLPFSL